MTYTRPLHPAMPDYTEGVCSDGAAILCDGRMMTIDEVLSTLNGYATEIAKLRKSIDAAAYADWTQHSDVSAELAG
jgi:hypothetical protein